MNAPSSPLEAISNLPTREQQVALGALLSSLFARHHVQLTVVGGAAVQFYTQAEYVTGDLDAILVGDTIEMIEDVMGGLGFKRTTMYRHFEHPLLPFVVEFPPSPMAVGSRELSKVNIFKYGGSEVRVIRVEDIIMDRIIGGVEWDQDPLMDQARLLWIKNKDIIDKKYLRGFARQEGYIRELTKIMKEGNKARGALHGKSKRHASP